MNSGGKREILLHTLDKYASIKKKKSGKKVAYIPQERREMPKIKESKMKILKYT